MCCSRWVFKPYGPSQITETQTNQIKESIFQEARITGCVKCTWSKVMLHPRCPARQTTAKSTSFSHLDLITLTGNTLTGNKKCMSHSNCKISAIISCVINNYLTSFYSLSECAFHLAYRCFLSYISSRTTFSDVNKTCFSILWNSGSGVFAGGYSGPGNGSRQVIRINVLLGTWSLPSGLWSALTLMVYFGAGCCRAMNARCLSCSAGMTEEEFCQVRPRTNYHYLDCPGNQIYLMSCAALRFGIIANLYDV